MAVSRLVSFRVLLLLVVCVVALQYVSLLQVRYQRGSGRAAAARRTLFTLDWGEPAIQDRKPLLTAIAEYLRSNHTGSDSSKDRQQSVFTFSVVTANDDSIEAIANVSKDQKRDEKNSTKVSADSKSSNDSASSSSHSPALAQCPLIPEGLHGPVKVVTDGLPANLLDDAGAASSLYPWLSAGGRHRPPNCTSRHRVAIVVPYRDRQDHLRIFLANMHAFLSRQMIDYGIYIVEQAGQGPFNRAMLMNVGAKEALGDYDYQCFVFHDVDLVPEDDRNLYTCPRQPRHMSVAINSFLYRLPYDDIFGGVSAMSVKHFELVNGFSNLFWGWGGEDDDMSNRLKQKSLYISRYPANIARYKMLRHVKDKANPERFKYLYSGHKRMGTDGFNSLKYTRLKFERRPLYTWVLVELAHLKK